MHWKKLFILPGILLFAWAGYSASTEQSATVDEFLLRGTFGAMATGAGSVPGLARDASLVILHPALIPSLEHPSFQGARSRVLDFSNFTYLSYAQKVSDKFGGLGFSVLQLAPDEKKFVARDEFGAKIGTFSVSNTAILIGYGRHIYRGLSAGMNLRFITIKVGDFSDQASDVGMSLNYKLPWHLNADLVIDNIMRQSLDLNKKNNISDALDRRIHLGLRHEGFFKRKLRFGLSIVTTQRADNSNALSGSSSTSSAASDNREFRAGVIYRFKDFAEIAGGFQDDGISLGLRGQFKDFTIGYGLRRIKDIDGNIHLLEGGWLPGYTKSKREKKYARLMKEALSQYGAGDYGQAIKNLEEAKSTLKRPEAGLLLNTIRSEATRREKEKKSFQTRSREAFENGEALFKTGRFRQAASSYGKVEKGSGYETEALRSGEAAAMLAKNTEKLKREKKLRTRAILSYKKGDYTDALAAGKDILKIFPKNPVAKKIVKIASLTLQKKIKESLEKELKTQYQKQLQEKINSQRALEDRLRSMTATGASQRVILKTKLQKLRNEIAATHKKMEGRGKEIEQRTLKVYRKKMSRAYRDKKYRLALELAGLVLEKSPKNAMARRVKRSSKIQIQSGDAFQEAQENLERQRYEQALEAWTRSQGFDQEKRNALLDKIQAGKLERKRLGLVLKRTRKLRSRALTLLSQKDFTNSLFTLNTLLRLDLNNEQKKETLDLMQKILKFQKTLKTKEKKGKRKKKEKLLPPDPSDLRAEEKIKKNRSELIEIYFRNANRATASNKIAEALRWYKKILSIDPKNNLARGQINLLRE